MNKKILCVYTVNSIFCKKRKPIRYLGEIPLGLSYIMSAIKHAGYDFELFVFSQKSNVQKDINILYNEPGNNKSIKYISLDLLLKKIVIDDFLEKNMLLIYYFCQQCFCFIDTKLLFNKIINCYHYYRSKGVPPLYFSIILGVCIRDPYYSWTLLKN